MTALKDSIGQAVDRLADELEALSRQIHAHPELAYQEVKACGWLSDFLARQGFKVEKGVGGVDTAFRATIETGEGPTIAILCEYDALPGIGHACGHNVIATSGVGAGAALAAVKAQLPRGRIQVIGTPAEEGGGGKVKLIKGGVFRDVDCAMMIHGFDRTLLHQDLLGIARGTFEFTGKASHASADPWEGVNALDACIQMYNAVSMLRQQIRPDCRVHGIITNGGAAANIIPEYASAIFYVRAPRIDTMWDLYRRVSACAEGAARATGCSVKITQHDAVYEPMKSNRVMLDLFAANMKTAGLVEGVPIPDRLGSSDIGNVSQVIPAIQPMVAIAPSGMAIHTREFADAAVTPLARAGMVAAAKTMALTTLDLLAEPARVKAAKDEFAKST
jgi:amidohydrolase